MRRFFSGVCFAAAVLLAAPAAALAGNPVFPVAGCTAYPCTTQFPQPDLKLTVSPINLDAASGGVVATYPSSAVRRYKMAGRRATAAKYLTFTFYSADNTWMQTLWVDFPTTPGRTQFTLKTCQLSGQPKPPCGSAPNARR